MKSQKFNRKSRFINLIPKINCIINEILQMATGPATSLFIGNFYLDEEVAQTELRRALAEDGLT
jgi:hypothetical protein